MNSVAITSLPPWCHMTRREYQSGKLADGRKAWRRFKDSSMERNTAAFSHLSHMPLLSQWPQLQILDTRWPNRSHTYTHTHLNVVSEEVASIFVLELLCGQQRQDKVFWHLQGTVLSHTWDTWTHKSTQTQTNLIKKNIQSSNEELLESRLEGLFYWRAIYKTQPGFYYV